MLTRAEQLKTEIAREKARIKWNTERMGTANERQRLLCIEYDERLHNALRRLEEQLKREEAQMQKPQPERVDCDGWSI
jgi:hypothetical protein